VREHLLYASDVPDPIGAEDDFPNNPGADA
jgi:hypothetical protein